MRNTLKVKHTSGSENISIGITGVVRDKHCSHPTPLIGLQKFFKMLNRGSIEKNFLPLLTFIDAVQKQDATAEGGNPPIPHRDT